MDLTLSDQTARQIANVLRLKRGDQVQLFNGDGSECTAEITDVRRGSVEVRVSQREPGLIGMRPALEIGLALIKHERFEWALQKLTELGVTRVIPLTTERTVLSFRADRAAQRLERWQRIVIEASEQSGRATLPSVEPVVEFADLLAEPSAARTIVLWEDEQAYDLPRMLDDRPTLLLVGPEGGFSAAEVDQAREMGAETASLGPLTLRAETAAVAAAAMMMAHRLTQETD